MSPQTIFNMHLILGDVAWLLCFRAYLLPKLESMDQSEEAEAVHRGDGAVRFDLVFIPPGVVGPNLPAGFGAFAAYWDFATGVLAIPALLTVE